MNQKIWLYDKHQGKSFRTNIRNAFVEGDYNTVVGDDFTMEAEQIFTRAEDLAAPILKRILSQKDVQHLTDDERASLATFVAIQHSRTKQSRRNFTLVREYFKQRFPDIPQTQFELQGLSPLEADKYISIDFIVKNLADLTAVIASKHLLLVELTGPGSFWISDHPVVLHNDNRSQFTSNVGFGVAGIQIYLPISSSYAIAYFCPTIIRELEEGVSKIEALRSKLFARSFTEGTTGSVNLALTDMKYQQKKVERLLTELRDVRKIGFNKQNLLFLNSSQVLTAHRFIGSCDDKFALVTEMLKQNPDIRAPNLIRMG